MKDFAEEQPARIPPAGAPGGQTSGQKTGNVPADRTEPGMQAEDVQACLNPVLKGILDSTESAVFSLDRLYRYTLFNAHHARLMKKLYGADIQLGHSMVEYLPANEEQQNTKRDIDRALAGEQFTKETFSAGEIRSRRYCEVTYRPVKDAGNEIIGIAVFTQDITDRKQTENALRASEERYRRITDGLTDYQYTVRVQDGRAVSTTHGAACVAVTGYTAEEFAADPYLWIRMVFDEDRNRVISHVNAVLSGKPVPPVEHRIVRKDGQVRWVRDTPIFQFDADGTLLSYDGVIKDITERKQAEEAVRESEGRVRQKLESLVSPEGDIGTLELGDILDREVLPSLMDDFTRLTGMATAILDTRGNVLVATGWQEICTRFHRVNPVTAGSCNESDLHLSKNMKRGEYVAYKCRSNLWDVVTPLYIGNRHMGNIFTGQFFYEDDRVDDAVFIQQAEKYGFDREAYLAALHRVPRFSRQKVQELMDYLVKLTDFISRLSFSNLTLARTVNERNRLLDSLQESERKYRMIFNNAILGIFRTSPDGAFLEMNPAFARMYGYESFADMASAVQDHTQQLYVHAEDRIRLENQLAQGNVITAFDVEFYHRDGHAIWISINAHAVQNAEGVTLYNEGTAEDITERKRMESELAAKHGELMASFEQLTATERELKSQLEKLTFIQDALVKSEERFRLTLDATRDGIWDWDVVKGTTFFSHNWYTMLGYEPGELPASHATWRSLVYPEDLGPAEQMMKDHIRTHAGYAVEVRMRTKQGGWRWILSRGRVVELDAKGNPARVIGTHTDIDERKRAEQALADSEAFLVDIINTQPAAVYRIRSKANRPFVIDGSYHFSYDFISDRYCELTGLSRSELTTNPLATLQLIHPEDINSFIEENKKADLALARFVWEGRMVVRSQTLWVHIESVPRIAANGDRLWTGVLIDITARKLIQGTLMRVNQKLNVLSELTRKDLTSFIFILKSYVELAKKDAALQGPVLKDLQKIERTVRSINDITEISKDFQNMGEKPPEWQNVNMALLFGLSHITPAKIEHNLETGALEIFADPLLEKAFQGLFENSLEHGSHVSRIRVSYTKTPEGIVIIYEDDGDGIPSERKQQIFLRGDTLRTSVRGLFFVREILDITGITIEETGEPGKGARFEMTVPAGMWRITGA
jgi:PAS domain S-box-containing protein